MEPARRTRGRDLDARDDAVRGAGLPVAPVPRPALQPELAGAPRAIDLLDLDAPDAGLHLARRTRAAVASPRRSVPRGPRPGEHRVRHGAHRAVRGRAG